MTNVKETYAQQARIIDHYKNTKEKLFHWSSAGSHIQGIDCCCELCLWKVRNLCYQEFDPLLF